MKFLVSRLRDIYFHKSALYAALAIVFIFCLGFAFPFMVVLGKLLLIVLVLLIAFDLIRLFKVERPLNGQRIIENKLSNGDFNPVILQVTSFFPLPVTLSLSDEFPEQLQLRDEKITIERIDPLETTEVTYEIRPTTRGVYQYGNLIALVNTRLSLISRRVAIKIPQEVKVYPSFIQFRKYSFLAISNRLEEVGVKKVRKLGLSNEFEQIREYVRGDDFRTVNWKATARRRELMVNQYDEEKSQNIYCLIDKGRLMHMPFEGLSLLDYSINAALVMSGVALGRSDKSGLLTFSDKIGTFIPAERKSTQMSLIADALYDQEVRLRETDFARLYKNVRYWIKKRSLLILFTNFDSLITLKRQLKYIQALTRSHLVCTVIFDNSEVNKWADEKAFKVDKVYRQTVAEKFKHDKHLIVKELNKHGIYTILTEPQDLTIYTINKYLQLKAQGAL